MISRLQASLENARKPDAASRTVVLDSSRKVQLPVMVKVGVSQISTTLVDVSSDGGRISTALPQPVGSVLEITIDTLPVRARIVAVENDCTRLQFALDTATHDRLEVTLTKLAA